MASKGDAAPLTVEQRLERLEAVTIPPIPENLCGRLEDLERMGRRLSDEGAEIRTRTTELERGWRWASDKLAEQESAFGSLETKIATLDSFRIGHSVSMGKLSDRLRNLEEFRGRFDGDLVTLTRRIAAAEAFEKRIVDLERARNLVLHKLEELGAWTTPESIPDVEEHLRNEGAEMRGRADAVLDHCAAPFDAETAAAVYRVGSLLAEGVLALLAALVRTRKPERGGTEDR